METVSCVPDHCKGLREEWPGVLKHQQETRVAGAERVVRKVRGGE